MARATRERRAIRRMLSTVAMLGLVVGVLAATGGSASATFPGRNGRIAFATDTGTGPQVIKTVKRDGTDLTRVAAHALSETGHLTVERSCSSATTKAAARSRSASRTGAGSSTSRVHGAVASRTHRSRPMGAGSSSPATTGRSGA